MFSHLAWWGTIACHIVDLVSWHHSIVGNIVYASSPRSRVANSDTSTLADTATMVLVAPVVLQNCGSYSMFSISRYTSKSIVLVASNS